MGISSSEFWDMTPRELYNAIEGYTEQALEKDLQEWKKARWMVWVQLALKDKQTDKITPGQLLPLEEHEAVVTKELKPAISPEQEAEIAAKWDAIIASKNNVTDG